MDIDWSKAPEGATHYSEYYGVFVMPYAPGKWLVQSDNGGKVVTFMDVGIFIPRPTKPAVPEWDEDGEFPPTGERVEACVYGDWQELVVSGYGNKFCIAINDDGEDVVFEFNDRTFRPLRTAEQRQREELACLLGENMGLSHDFYAGADAILSRYNLEPKK